MCKEYHCEQGGWLPTDGVKDEVDGIPLLIPTEFVSCPICNIYSYSNDDLCDYDFLDDEQRSELTISMLKGGQ
jgi:hypothetical protein